MILIDPKPVMENSEALRNLIKIDENIEEVVSTNSEEVKNPRSPGRPKMIYEIPPQDLFEFL